MRCKVSERDLSSLQGDLNVAALQRQVEARALVLDKVQRHLL